MVLSGEQPDVSLLRWSLRLPSLSMEASPPLMTVMTFSISYVIFRARNQNESSFENSGLRW